ncbi:hypothetical protein [Bacillus sp. SD088]|uniref:hypothetical protein n=1 Tax=Bacillus sp. SD088 TaxID=2782012 RepID=UPI001A95667E|nr:hypothetical protein [Bacillus sp. SD088]MBO0995021.1 hypothetical protein [Bacillus sp. SD088]
MEKIIFGKELAKTIGLNESIVVEKLYEHVEKAGTPLNGQVWIERTYEEWQEDFPFWSISTIKRIFASLKKQGLILIEQHGKHRYDRTNWYALSENGTNILPRQKLTANKQGVTTNKRDATANKSELTTNKTLATTSKLKNTFQASSEINTPQMKVETQEKIALIQKHLKRLHFFPLRSSQKEELAYACKTFSLKEILQALETTAERAIFAWKYAYKVLLTQQTSVPTTTKRKIIRTEKVPDWFQQEVQTSKSTKRKWDQETLARKRRLQEIQKTYRPQGNTGLC